MIRPTVGRIVHFYRRTNHGNAGYTIEGPHFATVLAVHGDSCVNVQAIDGNGKASFHSSIHLRQPEAPQPQGGHWVEWMPYQQEQASLSAAIARSVNDGACVSMPGERISSAVTDGCKRA